MGERRARQRGWGAELSDLLVRLSAQSAGRWVLARIDVAANPRIAQAFGVQSAPAVFAVLKGQPVPLFSEALPSRRSASILTSSSALPKPTA